MTIGMVLALWPPPAVARRLAKADDHALRNRQLAERARDIV